jgi:hypothetical protein
MKRIILTAITFMTIAIQSYSNGVSSYIDRVSPRHQSDLDEGRMQLSESATNYLMSVQNYHVGAVMGIVESENNLGHKFVVLYLRQLRSDPRFVVDYAGMNGWHPREFQDTFFYKVSGSSIEIVTKNGMTRKISPSRLLNEEKARVLNEFPISIRDRESEYYR